MYTMTGTGITLNLTHNLQSNTPCGVACGGGKNLEETASIATVWLFVIQEIIIYTMD